MRRLIAVSIAAVFVLLAPALAQEQEILTVLKDGAVLIDVRTPEEFRDGHVERALNIPYDEIHRRIESLRLDKTRPIVLYCRTGRRSGIALGTLREAGYTRIFNAGGLGEMERILAKR
jgi:phage shock protein E